MASAVMAHRSALAQVTTQQSALQEAARAAASRMREEAEAQAGKEAARKKEEDRVAAEVARKLAARREEEGEREIKRKNDTDYGDVLTHFPPRNPACRRKTGEKISTKTLRQRSRQGNDTFLRAGWGDQPRITCKTKTKIPGQYPWYVHREKTNKQTKQTNKTRP